MFSFVLYIPFQLSTLNKQSTDNRTAPVVNFTHHLSAMLTAHDLPPPPLDKSHSDHGLDIQPAVIDVIGGEEAVVVRTPSHSLPAVAFPSLQAEDVHQKLPSTVAAHGGFTPASKTGSGTLRHDLQVPEDGGLDGAGGFLDVDDDVAMHIDRDPNHWHDVVRVRQRIDLCVTDE